MAVRMRSLRDAVANECASRSSLPRAKMRSGDVVFTYITYMLHTVTRDNRDIAMALEKTLA